MGKKPANRFPAALLALCTGALAPGSVDGLTLFRIGGPPPDEQGIDVVHLSWEEAAAGYGGSVRSLDFEEGRMAPVLLDPDRNISLDVLSLGAPLSGPSTSEPRTISTCGSSTATPPRRSRKRI